MIQRITLISFTMFVHSAIATPLEIMWDDLIPQQAREILLQSPPAIVNHSGPAQSQEVSRANSMMQDSLDGQLIKLPGFVVPLEGEPSQIRTFFLVPYMGACIHVPPPPPNQIVFSKSRKGIDIGSLEIPVWAIGRLTIDMTETPLGIAGYTLDIERIEPYEDW